MSKYLVGFFRNENKIESIYSNQNTYYDYNLNETYIAKTVPLKCYTNSKKWELSSYASSLDSITKSLLEKNVVWMSSQQEESIFYALMYTQKDIPEMSRTGYLLIKLNNQLQPIIATIDNADYLIEIKGLGSPVGGFPNTHFRNQAGCFNKSHVRITGGLFEKEAYNEFKYLKQKDDLFINNNIGSFVKPLGVTTFHYLDFDFGVLLRLVPSSLRASFMRHPEFDKILYSRIDKGYFHMGQCQATLLESNPPLKHQNLSLNNMVYVDKNAYDLTDWSEVQSLFSFPEMLDYILCIYPILYFNYQLSLAELNYYLKGLNSVFKHKHTPFKSFKDSLDTHNKVVHSLGANYYKTAYENGVDFSGIKSNYLHLKDYFPDSYFSSSTKEWLEHQLLPSVKQRKEILKELLLIRKKIPKSILTDVLNFKLNDKTADYLTPLFDSFSLLKSLTSKDRKIKPLKEAVNDLSSSTLVIHELLSNLDSEDIHLERINQLEILENDLLACLPNLNLVQPNEYDFLIFKFRPTPINPIYLLYPFTIFIYSFLISQILLLNGSLNHSKSDDDIHIRKIISYYESILTRCAKEPESLKTYFKSNSPNTLIKFLSWPSK